MNWDTVRMHRQRRRWMVGPPSAGDSVEVVLFGDGPRVKTSACLTSGVRSSCGGRVFRCASQGTNRIPRLGPIQLKGRSKRRHLSSTSPWSRRPWPFSDHVSRKSTESEWNQGSSAPTTVIPLRRNFQSTWQVVFVEIAGLEFVWYTSPCNWCTLTLRKAGILLGRTNPTIYYIRPGILKLYIFVFITGRSKKRTLPPRPALSYLPESISSGKESRKIQRIT